MSDWLRCLLIITFAVFSVITKLGLDKNCIGQAAFISRVKAAACSAYSLLVLYLNRNVCLSAFGVIT